MLWRISSVNLLLPGMLPSAVTTAAAVQEMGRRQAEEGRSRGEQGAGQFHPRVDFICDADGNVSEPSDLLTKGFGPTVTSVAVVVVKDSLSSAAKAAGAAAGAATEATVEAGNRVASATRDAATWVGDATSGVAMRFRRQLANAEATERLNQDVALRMKVLEELAELKELRVMVARMRAMFAVGMAIAAADGEISTEEHAHIEEFVGGAAHAALPAELAGALELWRAVPPSIEEAFAIALECGLECMPFFDNVITVAIEADGEVHPAELEFKARWQSLREAAGE